LFEIDWLIITKDKNLAQELQDKKIIEAKSQTITKKNDHQKKKVGFY